MNNQKESGSAVGAILGTAIVAIVGVVGGWIAHDMYARRAKAAGEDAPAPQKAATGPQTVAIETVTEKPYNLPRTYVAHVEAMQEVELQPQVDGYIKQIFFKEGDLVKEGQLLYQLDDERYQAVVNQRKADLEAAEAEARRTERYWERMKSADARGITQLERDNAEAGAESARAAVLQAKANLVVAEYDCKKAKVVAPIAGQIGKSSAYVGDYVSPSKGALARIVQIDPIRVSFPLTDREYVAWRGAQSAGNPIDYRTRVQLPDGSIYAHEGAFDYDDNEMSRTTATILMRLKFANPDRLLVPNGYVTVYSDLARPPMYPTVSESAIVDLAGGNLGVYVIDEKTSTVSVRNVERLSVYDGLAPIAKGLASGEKVVVSGTRKLYPGCKVRVVEATAKASGVDK
ncbi:MAG: efflux RND transporter periplasmic adaptor subunit [Kiritimatiellia bacterium]